MKALVSAPFSFLGFWVGTIQVQQIYLRSSQRIPADDLFNTQFKA
jgi:hypothetical protein